MPRCPCLHTLFYKIIQVCIWSSMYMVQEDDNVLDNKMSPHIQCFSVRVERCFQLTSNWKTRVQVCCNLIVAHGLFLALKYTC